VPSDVRSVLMTADAVGGVWTYALDLARDAGLALSGAENAGRLLREAIAEGHGKEYWPTISRLVGRRSEEGR